MIVDFILDNFFIIVKLLIIAGVALYIIGYAKKPSKINNEVISDNIDNGIDKNKIINDNNKTNKNARILKGVGATAVVVGVILLVLGFAVIVLIIYAFIHIMTFIAGLD